MCIRKCMLILACTVSTFNSIGVWSAAAIAAFVPSLTLVGNGDDWCKVTDNGPGDLDDHLDNIIRCSFDKVENGISYKGTVIAKSEKDFAQVNITFFDIRNTGADVKPIVLRSYLDYQFDSGLGITWASIEGDRTGGRNQFDIITNEVSATTFDSNMAIAQWTDAEGDQILDKMVRHGRFTMGQGELSLVLTGNIGPNEKYNFPGSLVGTAVVPEPSFVVFSSGMGAIGLSRVWRRKRAQ
jgi:hypothetical protein